MTLREAAGAIGARVVGEISGSFDSVCTDTRAGAAGSLFFALRGENGDGHRFVGAAMRAGAVAAVVDHETEEDTAPQLVVPDTLIALGALAAHYRSRFALPVVGITGSVGKTSTRDMVACALAALGPVHVSRSNFNNEIGVPHTLFGLDRNHRAVVLEMAMRGRGQIARLAEIATPTIGVITNIGLSHIELLGSRDAIASAKAEILKALPESGAAAINADDEYAAFLRSRCRCRVVTFGIERPADFQATDVTFTDDGEPRFLVAGQPIAIHAPGVHHIINAAAACAVASALGIPVEVTAAELERFRPPAMRMAVRRVAGDIILLDDSYNAAPDSVRAALNTLALLGGARRMVAVLGDMRELGDWTSEAHRYVGEAAADRGVGLLVAVGPAAAKIADAAASRIGEDHIVRFPDAHAAARAISGLIRPGDAVLVKGSRAMEMERVADALTKEKSGGHTA